MNKKQDAYTVQKKKWDNLCGFTNLTHDGLLAVKQVNYFICHFFEHDIVYKCFIDKKPEKNKLNFCRIISPADIRGHIMVPTTSRKVLWDTRA